VPNISNFDKDLMKSWQKQVRIFFGPPCICNSH